MDYTSIGNTGIHTHSENDSLKSSKKATERQGLSFADTFSNYLPNVKQPRAKDMIEMQKMELRVIANMLIEDFRIQNEAKRIELIEKLLSKSKNEDEDSYSKCLEIYKKLMRGEKVSPEEMNYLMQFAPLLFLVYQMLKEDDKIVEAESEDDNPEQSAESSTDICSSSIAQAVLTYSPDTTAAAVAS